jgi:uncharacterized protein YyaL (SSP411 family)
MKLLNHLQTETSPYLLQHVHNPVDWYPWGPEALERAVAEDKPIIVSIGYSTCHWCHVMERESFEDQQVAAFMNAHFVNIKVDREERPDIDAIYMEACQLISGSGGWPLNCFLTPDLKPFFAGTYYPPQDAYGKPSWMNVLRHMADAFRNKRTMVEDQAVRLQSFIAESDDKLLLDTWELETTSALSSRLLIDELYYKIRERFDRQHGGFGAAPKFPGTMSLHFLLCYAHLTQNEEAIAHVVLSLEKMIKGGIYDQLEGGFSRYSTDVEWLAPHFEKMLYDNALICSLAADTYKITANPWCLKAIMETFAFLQTYFKNEEGLFYAAMDADSEGVEGKYYVWTAEEIANIVGEDFTLFAAYFDVRPDGNWEHVNILHVSDELSNVASKLGLSPEAAMQSIETCQKKLVEVRGKRIAPSIDTKVILGWNALLVTSFAKAYEATEASEYLVAATDLANNLINQFKNQDKSRYFHSICDGKPSTEGFLEDYAFLIAALLDLYKVSQDEKYLEEAISLVDYVNGAFLDEQKGLYFMNSQEVTDVLLRKKEIYDNATPSGNSTMALNLFKCYYFTQNEYYKTLASRMIMQTKDAIKKYTPSFARWAEAALWHYYTPTEVGVVGPAYLSVVQQLNRQFHPLLLISGKHEAHTMSKLVEDKLADVPANVYICKDGSCRQPLNDVQTVISELF